MLQSHFAGPAPVSWIFQRCLRSIAAFATAISRPPVLNASGQGKTMEDKRTQCLVTGARWGRNCFSTVPVNRIVYRSLGYKAPLYWAPPNPGFSRFKPESLKGRHASCSAILAAEATLSGSVPGLPCLPLSFHQNIRSRWRDLNCGNIFR
jgi:hypothetical protein